MLPVLFGALGLGAAAALTEGERQRERRYGAVSLSMGGRGVGAGTGVATTLGGRTYASPYEYDSPSSVVANWATGDIFGADEDDDEYGIMILGIPIGKESRLESLTNKIENAQAKIKELEEQAKSVEDDAEIAKMAKKIGRYEAKIEKWEEKKEKIEEKMGALEDEVDALVEHYGAKKAAEIVAADTMQKIEMLSNQVVNSAKKVRRNPTGKKAYVELLTMVASMDGLAGLMDSVVRPAMAAYVGAPASSGFNAAGMSSGMNDVMTMFGADPSGEPPEGLQDSVVRAQEAAQAYARTKREHPDRVKSMEEALSEASAKAGRDLSGIIIERVTLMGPMKKKSS